MIPGVDGLDPGGITGGFLLMIVGTTTPFPAEIAALAIAMRHGLIVSLALIWTGAMTGAVISYTIAAWLGNRSVISKAGFVRKSRTLMESLREDGRIGWLTILGLRLIPLVPFFGLSMAAGFLRVPVRDYLRGTAVGILPLTILLVLAGRMLLSENALIVALTVFGLIGGACVLVVWKWKGKHGNTLRDPLRRNKSDEHSSEGKPPE